MIKTEALTPTHLSPRPCDATLMAWLNDADVQAICQGKVESLMIGTKRINLENWSHFGAAQTVIILAREGKRERAKLIKELLAL